ncbi:3'(2'),5'-bisphosphate nucleotidase CysQ [Synechococcus sp. R6-6]|uniref:3'(2'),5'-bisphosphate nucleotidase CysQ n=1 Tax=unclassified Synechococcus TaxID=2626047 RepID=UPI0039C2F4C5
MQAQDLAALLPEVCRLAEAAGQAILPFYRQKSLPIQLKADASPLTEADLAAHHLILQGLQELTPGIPLLSEESSDIPYAQRQGWRHFWLVDPLDGTREFIEGSGQFTVNIALVEAGIPILGVVHAPALGLTYAAAQKLGACKRERTPSCVHEQPIRTCPYAQEPLQVVASRSHSNPETEQFLERLRQRCGSLEVKSVGSALKLCLVAEGSAHLYPRFGPTLEWDTAAAQCIVEQAGGRVTDLAGDPLRYNKPDLHNPSFVAAAEGMAQLWQNLIP